MEQQLKEYEFFLSIIYNKHAAKMKTGQLSLDEQVQNTKQSFMFEQELEDKGKFRLNEIIKQRKDQFNEQELSSSLNLIYENCHNSFLATYFKHLSSS